MKLKEVSFYKLKELRDNLAPNSLVFVHDKDTDEVRGYVTDLKGSPKELRLGEIPVENIVYEGGNQIEVVDGKLRVKKSKSVDEYININEGTETLSFSFNSDSLEKVNNKQNNLDLDGSGIRYPTVDAVNEKFNDVGSELDGKLEIDGSNATGSLEQVIFNSHEHINKPVLDNITDTDVQRWNTSQSIPTGFVYGMKLSINQNDSNKFDISPGVFVTTDYSDLSDIRPKIVNFQGVVGVAPTYLSTSNATYIKIDYNENIIQTATPFTNEDRRDCAIIGAVIHSDRENINVVNEIKAPLIANTNQLHDLMSAVGRINEQGNIYSPNGDNLQLNKSEGVIFGLGINPHNYKNPHELSLQEQVGLSFRYRTQDGSEGFDTTQVDPTVYDNNGVITTIPGSNKRVTVQRINMFPSGITRVQYGQKWYNSFNEAIQNYLTEPFITETNIADNAIFRSYLIVEKGVTNLAEAIVTGQARFVPINKFGDPVSGGSIALNYSSVVTALGFTPENVGNKQNNLNVDGTGTKYPTVDAINGENFATEEFINNKKYLSFGVTQTLTDTEKNIVRSNSETLDSRMIDLPNNLTEFEQKIIKEKLNIIEYTDTTSLFDDIFIYNEAENPQQEFELSFVPYQIVSVLDNNQMKWLDDGDYEINGNILKMLYPLIDGTKVRISYYHNIN